MCGSLEGMHLPMTLPTCTGITSDILFPFLQFPFAELVLAFFSVGRLCIVFLTFSCIGYAMPFILCATICCCLPCIISILGFREDLAQTRGATPESINSLPTYKFKLKKNRNGNDRETNSVASEGGGVVAAGTDKERAISGEDAVSFVWFAIYRIFLMRWVPSPWFPGSLINYCTPRDYDLKGIYHVPAKKKVAEECGNLLCLRCSDAA